MYPVRMNFRYSIVNCGCTVLSLVSRVSEESKHLESERLSEFL
jgi:hypothetical protein